MFVSPASPLGERRSQLGEELEGEAFGDHRAGARDDLVGARALGIHRERALADHEPDLVELAMSIANRIVNASIAVDPELVIDSCRGAMRKAFSRGNLQVLAHPADLERLRAAGPRLAEELGGVEHLDFVEERRMHQGSVVVRTPAGEIDGTIAGKAAKIEQALREGIDARRAAQRDASA